MGRTLVEVEVTPKSPNANAQLLGGEASRPLGVDAPWRQTQSPAPAAHLFTMPMALGGTRQSFSLV